MIFLWLAEVSDIVTNVYGGCGGSSYHNNIGIDNGAFRFKKEMWHAHYMITPYFNTTIGSIMNKWTVSPFLLQLTLFHPKALNVVPS